MSLTPIAEVPAEQETQLVAQARAGDEAAFLRLVEL